MVVKLMSNGPDNMRVMLRIQFSVCMFTFVDRTVPETPTFENQKEGFNGPEVRG